jgi:hypothetical protein
MNDMNPFIEYHAVHKLRHDGDQWTFRFPNGYGASVIRSSISYGGPDGLWELAVLDGDGDITYDTPVTGDVLGHLDEKAVVEALHRVAELPS